MRLLDESHRVALDPADGVGREDPDVSADVDDASWPVEPVLRSWDDPDQLASRGIDLGHGVALGVRDPQMGPSEAIVVASLNPYFEACA